MKTYERAEVHLHHAYLNLCTIWKRVVSFIIWPALLPLPTGQEVGCIAKQIWRRCRKEKFQLLPEIEPWSSSTLTHYP